MSPQPSVDVVMQKGGLRVERLVVSGTFELDGGCWEVDNNVWIVGDDYDVVIIDAPHDPAPILSALDDRNVTAVICTHGHNDHITAAAEVGLEALSPIMMHPADDSLWNVVYPGLAYFPLHCGERIRFACSELMVIHTPGHSPGSVSLWAPDLSALFSGDTLFKGGLGATGRSFSDFPIILGSIKDKLGKLPADTVVYTGHGDTTRIGDELGDYDDWLARGH